MREQLFIIQRQWRNANIFPSTDKWHQVSATSTLKSAKKGVKELKEQQIINRSKLCVYRIIKRIDTVVEEYE